MGVVNKLTCDGPNCPHHVQIDDHLYPMASAAGWICAKIEYETRGNARLIYTMPQQAYYFCSVLCMSRYFEGVYKSV